jgi:hypothetical protein
MRRRVRRGGLTGGGGDIGDAIPLTQKGAANGVANLDADTKIPRAQRPALDYISVKDFGAVGDGVTDDTNAIQDALDEARDTDGSCLFPPGEYRTTGQLTVQSAVAASTGALVASSAAVAVQLGVVGTTLLGKEVTLPRLTRSTADPHEGVGIKAVDMDGCVVTVPDVFDFEDCVVLAGNGQGIAYNTIIVGRLVCWTRNMVFAPVNNGWANSNTIIGGRWTHNRLGTDVAVAGTRQVEIVDGNSNVFLGCSMEGDLWEFHIHGTNATANRFYGCRLEVSAATLPKVHWGDTDASSYSTGNIIDNSFTAAGRPITVTQGTFANRNHVRDQFQWKGAIGRPGSSLGGLVLSNQNSDGQAVMALVSSSSNPHTADPNADYKLWLAAGGIRAKNTADANARIYLDAANGRLYFGDGTTDPTTQLRLRWNTDLELLTENFHIATAGKGLRLPTNAKILSGTGTPEAAVSAVVGSIFLRTDGNQSTTVYRKLSGSGSSGWQDEATVTVNAQTGTTYTTVLTDAGKVIELDNASAITLTVPTHATVAYPVGTQIRLLQTGAGQVTVAPAGGVTVNGTPGLKLSAQWAEAKLTKRASNVWVLTGSLSA